jgi:hypothetical protein
VTGLWNGCISAYIVRRCYPKGAFKRLSRITGRSLRNETRSSSLSSIDAVDLTRLFHLRALEGCQAYSTPFWEVGKKGLRSSGMWWILLLPCSRISKASDRGLLENATWVFSPYAECIWELMHISVRQNGGPINSNFILTG